MKVSGFTFVRNARKFDYPVAESLSSLLPLCDELVVAVGLSEDDTLAVIRTIRSSKIRVIETIWDDSVRSGGTVLAQQTDIALGAVTGDWAIYLQADEVLHEKDIPLIRSRIQEFHADGRVEGLLFDYLHFYGSYDYVGHSRRWYRHEVRAVRTGIGVKSWGDAQGFRIGRRKLRVHPSGATIYHYGWVKPPAVQKLKQRAFSKLWHPDAWVDKHISTGETYDYVEGGRLTRFSGSHPAVMKSRVQLQAWNFIYTPRRRSAKDAVLGWFERLTGRRIGEYRNYELL